MGVLGLVLLLAATDPDDGLSKKMLPIYLKEAEGYSITLESAPKRPFELKKEPVFEWVNRARGDTQGVVFVWLRDGRPAALGCIFSFPHDRLPGRTVAHELHALDAEKIVVQRNSPNDWKPEAGLVRKELTDAPEPAATAETRLVQMRKLATEFTGYSVDPAKKKWELRLLRTPLYRYPTAKTGVIDGALFALVSDAGTDPEVLLVIEANRTEGKARWEFACGRFSDWELRVQRKDKEVYASVRSETNASDHDPLHLYRVYSEKVVTPEGKVLAKVRGRPNGGAELVPTNEKRDPPK
jgi:hypothetical protein